MMMRGNKFFLPASGGENFMLFNQLKLINLNHPISLIIKEEIEKGSVDRKRTIPEQKLKNSKTD